MRLLIGVLGLAALLTASARAAYLLEIDTDGADNGLLTFHPGFSFGGDTTAVTQSSSSTAFGTTGGDSIFGGDGTDDTYLYNYSPDADGDNLVIAPGQLLGGGSFASGQPGGGAGRYAVYATWPFSQNVTGGLTHYEVATAGDGFSASLDQNGGGTGAGNEWVKLGEIDYTGGAITVAQTPAADSFFSMRAYGLLFEAVPEPSGTVLVLLAVLMWTCRRQR